MTSDSAASHGKPSNHKSRALISRLTVDFADWIRWRPGGLEVDFLIDADHHIFLHSVGPLGANTTAYSINRELEHAPPLAQVRLLAEGSSFGTSERQVYSQTSNRLVYVSHTESTEDDDIQIMNILTQDPETNLQISLRYCVFGTIPVLRATAVASNLGPRDLLLQTLSPLSLGFLNRGCDKWWDDYQIVLANNTNFREAQWKAFDFPDLGMDYVGESDFDRPGTRAAVFKSSLGTFSTSTSLPMGALSKKDGNHCLAWQIEHSGSWKWEVGNIIHGLYLIAGGPNDQDHQWTKKLSPGETFTSVTTALAVMEGPVESVFGPFTQYRRRIRRKHSDNENLPVIFNDFMNCLKGDPTEEKVTALIEPALRCGAEYFVIDAGWYADSPSWWDSVGAWKPSTTRFPSGFRQLLDKIRATGMTPGV